MNVGKAKTMKNGLLYWLLLTGLIFVALGFIADKVDYCWQEETLAPPYRTVEMCVQLDRDLDHLMRGPDAKPTPESCLQEMLRKGIIDAIPLDSWGHAFEVRMGTNDTLHVWSCGVDGVRGTADDLNAESIAPRPHQRPFPWGGGI